MFDILLVIIAIVVGGAWLGQMGLSFARGDCLSWQSMDTFQQTYGARSFLSGSAPGSLCGCRYTAVSAALARPAPGWSTAPLDGWSGGGGLR